MGADKKYDELVVGLRAPAAYTEFQKNELRDEVFAALSRAVRRIFGDADKVIAVTFMEPKK